MDVTGAVAEYVAEFDVCAAPAAVLARTKTVLADTTAILLAASRGRAVRVARSTFPFAGGQCTVVGHGRGATAHDAALINGIGGHEIELDDSHAPSRTHPAAVIVPAALAAAEVASRASGRDLLSGIVAGYDIGARLSKAFGVQAQFDRGFHPACVCGSVAAAVAAARVLRLDERELRTCIALATSQSSGLMAWQDDSTHMVKSFQTGIAARNGVTAALLARNGYAGVADALGGRHSPLRSFGGPDADAALLVDELGERYEIMYTSIKLHGCGGQTHAALDALFELVAEHDLQLEDIDSLDVELAHAAIPVVHGNPLRSANVGYILAIAASERHADHELFADERPLDSAVERLASRVAVRGSDELDAGFPARKGAVVTVRTAAGESYSARRAAPHGNPDDPLTDDELRGKFDRLAGAVLDERKRAALWFLIGELEQHEHTDDLFNLLAATKGLVKQ